MTAYNQSGKVKRTVLKVQEVVYLVLEFRAEKQTFAKVDEITWTFPSASP